MLTLTAGADLYTTRKLMGHANVRTTQIYTKIIESKKIEAVNLVDKMFEGNSNLYQSEVIVSVQKYYQLCLELLYGHGISS